MQALLERLWRDHCHRLDRLGGPVPLQ
jgi:hypothetical protein